MINPGRWNLSTDFIFPAFILSLMKNGLTCANHSEEVVLDEIEWNRFNCPKCGSDYSIGRKVVLMDPEPFVNKKTCSQNLLKSFFSLGQ